MATRVYSFPDLNVVVSHPSLGQYPTDGVGVVSIRVTMATENSVQSVAADGRVITSKKVGKNGTVAVELQQISGLDQWLRNGYNTVYNGDASIWAELSISANSPTMGDIVSATGCSFKQRPERPYEAEAQNITWEFLAENIEENAL